MYLSAPIPNAKVNIPYLPYSVDVLNELHTIFSSFATNLDNLGLRVGQLETKVVSIEHTLKVVVATLKDHILPTPSIAVSFECSNVQAVAPPGQSPPATPPQSFPDPPPPSLLAPSPLATSPPSPPSLSAPPPTTPLPPILPATPPPPLRALPPPSLLAPPLPRLPAPPPPSLPAPPPHSPQAPPAPSLPPSSPLTLPLVMQPQEPLQVLDTVGTIVCDVKRRANYVKRIVKSPFTEGRRSGGSSMWMKWRRREQGC